MRRPKRSHCPEGQDFVVGRSGRLTPVHTPKLGARCTCGPCRGKRAWTPERSAARSAEYRARVAAGVQFGTHEPKDRADRWQPQHDALIRAMLGTADTTTIAEALTARFSWPRTTTSVRSRIKTLGLSRLAVRPRSRREVAHALGVSEELVLRWIEAGMLAGTPWRLGGGRRKDNISMAFSAADIERFLREHADLVHPERIRDRKLRALVEGLTRGRRALPLREAARLAGVPYANLMYWVKRGKVPSAYQVGGRFWRVPADALASLRAMPDQRTRAGRAVAS